jgi:hypothetical protein
VVLGGSMLLRKDGMAVGRLAGMHEDLEEGEFVPGLSNSATNEFWR